MKWLVVLIVLISSPVFANPKIIGGSDGWPRKPIQMEYEQVTIEIYDKYSRITGTFRFIDPGEVLLGYVIKLPVLKWRTQDYPHPRGVDAVVKLGDVRLHDRVGSKDDELSKIIQECSKEIDIWNVEFEVPFGSDITNPVTVSYNQQNFRVAGDAVSMYLPIIPGKNHGSDRHKIEIVNRTRGTLSLLKAKSSKSKISTDRIEIFPADKELIVVEYGKALEYGIMPLGTMQDRYVN